jgi:hypothetical protein
VEAVPRDDRSRRQSDRAGSRALNWIITGELGLGNY